MPPLQLSLSNPCHDFRHHSHRRCRGHDYRAPAVYHITILAHPAAPAFSSLCGDARIRWGNPGCAAVRTTPTGRIIERMIWKWQEKFPFLKVLQYIVMPDHLHFIVQVLERTEKHLGCYIGAFESWCSGKWQHETGREGSLFTDGYNDRIIFPWRNLKTVIEYIRQNPHRLLARRQFPEYFGRVSQLSVCGSECQAYGNLMLLRSPFIHEVIIHRRYTEEERDRISETLVTAAANGEILVSACIAEREKKIVQEAIDAGGRIILIRNELIAEREKPAGALFSLAEEGRLLILVPREIGREKKGGSVSRQECLVMNALAERLARQAAPVPPDCLRREEAQ